MNISIFGLGYVGSVSAACFAQAGHHIIGVDINPTKVEMINGGRSPTIEVGLEDLLQQGVAQGRLQATNDAAYAVQHSDVSLICVGTPSKENGGLNLAYVERVSQEIGSVLAGKDTYHVVVARSTILPGTTEEKIIPILESASGRQTGQDFGVCYNPEFLREGSSVNDFYHPPCTVIGHGEDDQAAEIVAELYQGIDAPLIKVPYKVAEMVKYANNAFHALKVVFSNEIGNTCKQLGIDSHQVMDIFCLDTKLNLSSYYLKPGFAFGGSCLPKDLRALLYHTRRLDLRLPVLEAILPSNQRQVQIGLDMILRTGKKRIGVMGFAFKAGTDDLRESPLVELIEQLIGKGYHIRVYDQNISLARLHGANRAYIEREIPHIANLMCDTLDEVLAESDIIVIGNKTVEFNDLPNRVNSDQIIIDFVRITDTLPSSNVRYQGICW